MKDANYAREQMVEQQVRAWDVLDGRVLDILRKVPREAFVPAEYQDLAYADLCYDGYQAPSILQVEGAKDVAVEFFTLSKSYSMPGWRVGFCCGNPVLVVSPGEGGGTSSGAGGGDGGDGGLFNTGGNEGGACCSSGGEGSACCCQKQGKSSSSSLGLALLLL